MRSIHWLVMMLQNKLLLRILTEAREGYGLLPGQPKVLEFLRAHPGSAPSEIVRGCALDKSTVNGLLGRMHAHGLIESRPDLRDRRKSHIDLTEAGRQRADDFQRFLDDLETDLTESLPPGKREEFLDMLSGLVECMSKEDKEEAAEKVIHHSQSSRFGR